MTHCSLFSQSNFHSPYISVLTWLNLHINVLYFHIGLYITQYLGYHCNSLIIITHFFICPFTFVISPTMHPITINTISILKPGLLSVNSKVSCWYFCSSPLLISLMFFALGHAMAITAIFLISSRCSSTRSGQDHYLS